MSGKSIRFGDKEINKRNLCKNKKPFKVEDIDIIKALVSLKKSNMVKKQIHSYLYWIQ